jgi:hypothetical protein
MLGLLCDAALTLDCVAGGFEWAVGVLVRLRPEFAPAYPLLPADRWLPANRADNQPGVVWLEEVPDRPGAAELPVFEAHVWVRKAELPG